MTVVGDFVHKQDTVFMGKTTYMGNFNCSMWGPENSYSVCLHGLAGGDKAETKVQL